MKGNMEIVENIMKPYFDKKQEIESSNNILRLRLEKLLDNKEKEINEYVADAVNSNSNFYSGYETMVRRDLELAYKQKEESLREQINNSNKFKNVDLRELVGIKEDIRKQLFAEQKILNTELKEQQIYFDMSMLKLHNFKYEYNDQQQVINGDEWRSIYENGNRITDKINQIKETLNKIQEYLVLTELTHDEAAALMRSMTPWEEDEYNRRKQLNQVKGNLPNDKKEQLLPVEFDFDRDDFNADSNNELKSIEESFEDETFEDRMRRQTNKALEDMKNDIQEIDDPVVSNYDFENSSVIVDNMGELLKTIYNDIIEVATSMETVKLNGGKKLSNDEYYIRYKKNDEDYKMGGLVKLPNDELKLPCGEYLNSNDVNEAINEFYKRNKGMTYKVKETGREYKISKLNILKLKHELKKCSTVKLVKENKISKLDIMKVFGKKKVDDVMKEVELSNSIETSISEGCYINRNEFILKLDNLLTNNRLKWLKKLSSKLKKNDRKSEKVYDDDYDYDIELDDDFLIKQK